MLSRMKLGTKVLLTISIVLILLGISTVFTYYSINKLAFLDADLYSNNTMGLEKVNRISLSFNRMRTNTVKLSYETDKLKIADLVDKLKGYHSDFLKYKTEYLGTVSAPEDSAIVRKLSEHFTSYDEFHQKIISLKNAEKFKEAEALSIANESKIGTDVVNVVVELIDFNAADAKRHSVSNDEIAKNTKLILLLLSGASILIGIILTFLISRNVKNIISSLNNSTTDLINELQNGNLKKRGNPELINFEFRDILIGINSIVEELLETVQMTSDYLQKISQGLIPERLDKEVKGDYNEIKNSINLCVEGLQGLVEANNILQRVAHNDYTNKVHGHFNGIFAQVSDAINYTIDNTAEVIRRIKESTSILAASSEELSSVSTGLVNNSDEMLNQSNIVASATEEMSTNINTMASASEEMSVNATSVASAAEQMSENMNAVSAAVEEMSASIKDISSNSSNAQNIANNAISMATTANTTMDRLGEAAKEIGKVTDVIKRIAEQTNLLALNATIEAASAGEAGKGFAVVANEIKELANQSAQAAGDIALRIEGVQGNTSEAVKVITDITEIISKIGQSVETISLSVDYQTKASNEISNNILQSTSGVKNIAISIGEVAKGSGDTSRNAGEAAKGARSVAASIGEVRNSAHNSTMAAKQVNESSHDLSQVATTLKNLVDNFEV